MSSPTDVTVNVRGIAFGGAGVGEVTAQNDGRSDLLGITAFVPYTAPGEIVSARVSQRKERYIHGELISLHNSAEGRREPPCSLFTICGGCELQHLRYESQLKTKFEMISGALRAAQLSIYDLEKLAPIVPSPELGYRRRVTLHVDPAGHIGFYRNATRSVVPTTHCPIAVKAINDLLVHVQDFGREVQGKISSLLLEADDTGVVAVLKSPYDVSVPVARAILSSAKRFFPNALLIAADREVEGYGRQILEIPLHEKRPLSLRVPAGFFSQVNATINAKLVTRAVELIGPNTGERVLDLYAGAGNFSLPFARAGASVTAVECDTRLVALGRENAGHHNLRKNLEYAETSVEKYLRNIQKLDPPSVLIADPPRSGLGALVSSLPAAERLILVSCHLPSFVRDTKALLEDGYEIETMIPYDMFAQTTYVEMLSLFVRTSKRPLGRLKGAL